MENPLISVIIPVYNCSQALKRSLESVLSQTYSNFEIWVIDDGSEIELYPIIEELNDKRINYYKLEHCNANVARNYGIEKSRGKYIAMLDVGDLWMETHLEECLTCIRNKNVNGIYGSVILRDIQSNKEQRIIVRELEEGETLINYLLSTGYGAQTSTLFMTAESVKKVLWNPELNRHQDYDFTIRYNKEYNFAAKEHPTVVYIMEPKQIKIDFNSCIRVIKENQNDINPILYHRYHTHMLRVAKQQQATNEIIEHYKNEATYYKEFISYYQYLMIKRPQTKFDKLKCKMEYLSYILKIQVEYS